MTVHNPYDDTVLLADVADIQDTVDAIETDVAAVQATVDGIEAVTDGLPTLTHTLGSTTTTTIDTEYALYINNAPLGVYRPVCCKVWFLNQTATETVKLRTYYRVADGGVWALQDEAEYSGVMAPVLINIDLEPTRWGIQITIERTAGTARAYPWEASFEI